MLVGDLVERIGNHSQESPVGTRARITQVFGTGFFNHDGPACDHHPLGGCSPKWWRKVDESVPTARKNDPATSKGKRRVNKYEQTVLEIVGRNPTLGVTGKDIALSSGFPLNCITPRFAPLRRKGLIKDSGVRRDKQIVWVPA